MEKIADRDELLELPTQHAREGSVYAARCLLDELRREGKSAEDGSWAEIYGKSFEELDASSNIASLKPTARKCS
jgi:hypothetical protein